MSQPLKTHEIQIQGDPVIAYILHGRNGIGIQERLRMVADDKKLFQIVAMENFSLEDRYFVKATIMIDAKTYMAASEIRLKNAKSGADKTAPIEMAQTRAVRNALENAGYGITGEVAASAERPTKKCQTFRGDDIIAYMYSGNPYSPVSERVRIAFLHEDTCYHMVSYDVIKVANRYMLRIGIEMPNGARFIGDAEIRFGAHPSSPDGTWPIECGEPSALGRALGMDRVALIPGVMGLASADEMALASGASIEDIITTKVASVKPAVAAETFANVPSYANAVAAMTPTPHIPAPIPADKPIAQPDPVPTMNGGEIKRQMASASIAVIDKFLEEEDTKDRASDDASIDDEEF